MASSTNSSAGVYVGEINRSQRAAPATTSVGVIVGASDRGPVGEATLVTSQQEFLNLFGKPNPRTSKMHYCALEFLVEASRLYVTRVADNTALTAAALLTVDDVAAATPTLSLSVLDDGLGVPQGRHDPMNTYVFDQLQAGIENVVGLICAVNPGSWNKEIKVKVRPSTKRGSTAPDDPKLFYIEVYLPISVNPIESWPVTLGLNQDGYGVQTQVEQVVNTQSQFIRVLLNPSCPPSLKFLTSVSTNLLGGSNGGPATDGLIMQGWDLYSDPEQLDCNILINAGYATPAVQQHMNALAVSRRDCVAILDLPTASQTVAGAVAYRTGVLNIDSSYSAIYGPDLQILDTYNDMKISVPPSGHVAAVYARTDNVRALWFAPAGMTRGFLEIRGVTQVYNQGARDAFEDVQINPVRVIPGKGFFVWGADTLASEASALSDIPVRRLMNFMEKSLARASLYSVFDPNDQFLWMTLRDICDRFLGPIRDARGLYWFQTICDQRNNVAASIATGDVHLDVYVQPTIFAKRIRLNAIINKTGVTVTGSFA